MKKTNYEPPMIRIVKCRLQFMLNVSGRGIESSRQNYKYEEEEVWE